MIPSGSLPVYVVDASVAVKWHLRDEQDADIAVRVLADFRDGRSFLLAPDHIRYEVPSAIRNAIRTGRMTAEQGRAAITDFHGWQIPTVSDDALIRAGYEQALLFGCSLYDGLYLALAEIVACPLIYADNHLRNALGTKFRRALWLGDYRPLS
jgi:predicted nucleic acid-binding protein